MYEYRKPGLANFETAEIPLGFVHGLSSRAEVLNIENCLFV